MTFLPRLAQPNASTSLVACLVLAALTGMWPTSSAWATAPPESCIAFLHNVEGVNTIQEGDDTGVRSSMWFAYPSDDCMRVSSIAVDNVDGQVEIGWVLGWHPSADNAYTGTGACNDSYFGIDPELFLVWIPQGGSYHCRDLVAISPGQYLNLWVQDPESDTIWSANYTGHSPAWTPNVNFGRGIAVTNGERHSSTDSMWAGFQDLQWKVAGNPNWNDFNSSAAIVPDGDTSYHWTKHTDTWTTVDHD